MGLQCDITRTPEDFFQRIGPDTTLILLDLVMPEMDGIEILRFLGERNCKARIVLMSGINIRVIETAKKLAQSPDSPSWVISKNPFRSVNYRIFWAPISAAEKPADLEEEQRFAIPDEDLRFGAFDPRRIRDLLSAADQYIHRYRHRG